MVGIKERPADAKNKIYNYLFRHREKYEEEKHNSYMNKLRNKQVKNGIILQYCIYIVWTLIIIQD